MFQKLTQAYKSFKESRSPQTNLVLGFLLYTVIGFLLLLIPLFHNNDISIVDNLFTSASAISTTGLVSIDIAENYNFFGQFIIMCLIQIGGIGYMTLTTYFLLFTTKKLTKWHNKVIGAEFSMPKTFKIRDFIKSVIVYTLIMEVLGAIGLYISFLNTGMGHLDALWNGLFHSISSFCTAGFSLLPGSFELYQDNTSINVILSILAIAGSLGFIVITDLWYRLTRKSKKLSFSTKVIFYGFFLILTIGTLIFHNSPVSADDSHSLMQSFFQVMTAMTTVGFNTINLAELGLPAVLLMIFLMYIGASPSGTAGGLKITTLVAMFSLLKARLLGRKNVTFFNKKIPTERLYVATSTFVLYTGLIFLFTFLISYTEDFSFNAILFEVSSALGTAGLSLGITGDLSTIGKLLIVLLMLIGRVGVLTFGFSLLHSKGKEPECLEDDLVV